MSVNNQIEIIDGDLKDIEQIEVEMFVCETCDDYHDTVAGACQHTKKEHGYSTDWRTLERQPMEVFVCPDCDYTTTCSKMRVLRHFKASHDGYIRSPKRIYYDCGNCDRLCGKVESVYIEDGENYCSQDCFFDDYHPDNPDKPNQFNTRAGNEWRRAVFQRDDFTCQDCGVAGDGTNLCAHHILRRAEYPEYELMVWNGVTLCKTCHHRRHKDENGTSNLTRWSIGPAWLREHARVSSHLDRLDGKWSEKVWDDQPFIEEGCSL